MFSKQSKYQTAVKLAMKAWMMFMETGSAAGRRAFERMMRLARTLRVPAGALRAQLWMDVETMSEAKLRTGLCAFGTLGAFGTY
jgi:hypothetical protein